MSTQITFTRGTQARTIVFDFAERKSTFSAQLTDSPQERSSSVTDGWVNDPDSHTLSVRLVDFPIKREAGGSGEPGRVGRAAALLEELISVKREGLLCILQTPWRINTDVRIRSIAVTEDKTLGNTKAFTIEFRQTKIADSQTVPLVTPVERKPQPSTDKGRKGTGEADENKSKKSWAAGLKDGFSTDLKQLIPEFLKR